MSWEEKEARKLGMRTEGNIKQGVKTDSGKRKRLAKGKECIL